MDKDANPQSAPAPPATAPQADRTRFLVVDDMDGNRRLMRRLIEKHFPDSLVEEADSGLAALVRMREQPPDILILDVLMPDVDGLEVCRRMKADERTRSVLVMMVSGHMTDTASRISGLRSGADSYICKPFETNEFVAQLTALQRIQHTETALRNEQQRLQKELEARRRIERQLEAAKSAAEVATKTKSEFLAHMSHEIRTPMNAVIGMTEILSDTELTEDQREYVNTIHTASETLLMVINDILDFSKIESGRLALEKNPFRIDELVEEAVSMVRAQAEGKGLRLEVSTAPDTPLHVIGDTIRLRQIVSNLLSNAVKFTEQGTVAVRVESCRLDRLACEVRIAVADTGIGIPRNKMHLLFDSFSQLDDSTTRRFGGTGLGLAISKRLAELMGGGIWAESEEGRGSVFHVRVRLEIEKTMSPSTSPPAALPALEGKRILILDDDAVNRHLLSLKIQSWGLIPEEAAHPDKALERLRRDPAPDAILVDMQIPGMDGVAFARRVRHEEGLQALPLLLLSSTDIDQAAAYVTRAEKELAGRLFAAQLQKPVDTSTLFDVLTAVLRRTVPEATPPAEQPVGLAALRVLVAEDNAVNRKVAEYMLRRIGCRFDFAEDGRAAVAAARETRYDVILMDVQMPHMDGLEAMQTIRAEYAGNSPPRFVALTAHAMQGDREKYLAAGMDDYVSKPIREKELLRVLTPCVPPEAAPGKEI